MALKLKKIVKDLYIPFVLNSLILVFSVFAYYLAKFTPYNAVIVGGMFDELIPFSPPWVIFYVLWYPLLVFVPCYIYKVNKSDFYTYISIKFIIDWIAIFIFVFYPTIFNRPELVVNDFFTWVLNLVYINDTPALNCLPSTHCTVCFASIYTILKSNKIPKKCKVIATIIFMLIVLSTLFVKQHAIVDVIVAFILTVIVSLIVYKFKLDKQLENKIEKSRF